MEQVLPHWEILGCLCRGINYSGPEGTGRMTNVRTNIFTSYEPLLGSPGRLSSHRAPCEYLVWYHWHRLWILPARKYAMWEPWNVRRGPPGLEHSLGIYRSPNSFLVREKEVKVHAGTSSECSHCFLFHPEQELISGRICIYMRLHRSNQTSRCRYNSGIQIGKPTSVPAVTNTQGARKCRGGGGCILSLYQLTLKSTEEF